MLLPFVKMNGLGNDFIVIDDMSESLDMSPDAVAWFCDRHFGIGADGLMLVRPASREGADFYMHFFNADGSLAEMCGNGIRCFAKYLVDNGLVTDGTTSIAIDTLAGLKPVTIIRDGDGAFTTATVDMGVPEIDPARIPSTFTGNQVYECPIDTPWGEVRVSAVSMGNPHAIIWVDDVEEAPVDTVGPFVEIHERFPQGTNVEFVQVVDDATLRVRVWERGVGETLACGTGACASLVAAMLSCRTGREATIELPGGDLFVRWHEDEHVYLTGSATTSFSGSVDLPDVE